jgi:hypothetical protein
MTGVDDDRSEKEVREKTIEDLLDSNDLGDLQRMQQEMHDELDAIDDDREANLLEYRLSILEDAIGRAKRD